MSSREAPQARCHPARLLSSNFCQACLPLGPGTAADVLMTEGRRPWKGRGLWGPPSLAGEREGNGTVDGSEPESPNPKGHPSSSGSSV